MTLYLYRCLQSYMICSIFLNKKKIRKATFLLSHYWHPIASIVHPLPLFIEHWYYNITPSMDTCITYTRLCGILLSFLVFLPSGPIFFPYFFFPFFNFKNFFVVSTADSLSPPHSIPTSTTTCSLRWS